MDSRLTFFNFFKTRSLCHNWQRNNRFSPRLNFCEFFKSFVPNHLLSQWLACIFIRLQKLSYETCITWTVDKHYSKTFLVLQGDAAKTFKQTSLVRYRFLYSWIIDYHSYQHKSQTVDGYNSVFHDINVCASQVNNFQSWFPLASFSYIDQYTGLLSYNLQSVYLWNICIEKNICLCSLFHFKSWDSLCLFSFSYEKDLYLNLLE